MGNVFGTLFRIATFGESHGAAIGAVIDGCPPGLAIDLKRIQAELDRRRPGQSRVATPRKESDACEILSGVFEGRSLGTPISLLIRNSDARPSAYEEMRGKYRPSHADFAYDAKYGLRDWRGGGRSSARETAARVAAGAIARMALEEIAPGFEIYAWTRRVKDIEAVQPNLARIERSAIEANIVRCPDALAAEKMIALIDETRAQGDSVGGVIECVARGVPAGWGEPVFDKLDADLAKAMLSLPAAKGFEIGSGFEGTRLFGSEHNDPMRADKEAASGVGFEKNDHGGTLGGLSSGAPIVFRVAFKPTATIMKAQRTVSSEGENTELTGRGRHDPCVLPRAAPIVESMAALVLCDHALRHRAQCAKVWCF